VPAWQIVLHRIVWGAVLVAAWLGVKHGRGWLRETLRTHPRARVLLPITALLIAFNWSLYIWAVNAGHVIESSLGYFINPLINVLLGVWLLGERLRRVQWLAVLLALAGVSWLTWQLGHPPWIALGLAVSFGLYGYLRKRADVPPVRGLGVENLVLFVPALAALAWLGVHDAGDTSWGLGVDALLVLGGALTALPLIGYAAALRVVPLSTVGVLQYLSPTLQFLVGLLVFGEPFDRSRATGYGLVWLALAVFAIEGLWRAHRARPAATTAG
jgi:chloramphenicol-sensitive protein RarD